MNDHAFHLGVVLAFLDDLTDRFGASRLPSIGPAWDATWLVCVASDPQHKRAARVALASVVIELDQLSATFMPARASASATLAPPSMIANAGLLDLVYVGILLGNMALLVILWRVLPWLLREQPQGMTGNVTTHQTGMHGLPGPRALRKFSYAFRRPIGHRYDARAQHTLLR